jgi:NusA-like KH domain protein
MSVKLDITSIQYMNLFNKITGVKAKFFFPYSSALVFIVDPFQLTRALGDKDFNLRRLGITFKKRIKIIPEPTPDRISRFVRILVSPIRFKSLIIENDEIIIKAGSHAKASLIGRNHSNLDQLQDILKHYFHVKSVKIA